MLPQLLYYLQQDDQEEDALDWCGGRGREGVEGYVWDVWEGMEECVCQHVIITLPHLEKLPT